MESGYGEWDEPPTGLKGCDCERKAGVAMLVCDDVVAAVAAEADLVVLVALGRGLARLDGDVNVANGDVDKVLETVPKLLCSPFMPCRACDATDEMSRQMELSQLSEPYGRRRV